MKLLKLLDLIPRYKIRKFTNNISNVIKLYADYFSKDNNPNPIPEFQTKIIVRNLLM